MRRGSIVRNPIQLQHYPHVLQQVLELVEQRLPLDALAAHLKQEV